MASTRSKNTPGDYQLEQKAYVGSFLNIMDPIKQTPYQKTLPGNGLLQGKVASRDLANNYTDIESTLFGIGSTNLVQPLPNVVPDIPHLPSLNIIDKIPMIVPDVIYVDTKQRANYLN
jgi:hypothetical protein